MKKAILIATLFAVAGIASAQNTVGASAASAPATQLTTAEASKPAEAPAKAAEHKKVHAKEHVKHVKHAAKKKADQAKAAGNETVAKTDASSTQKAASTPAK